MYNVIHRIGTHCCKSSVYHILYLLYIYSNAIAYFTHTFSMKNNRRITDKWYEQLTPPPTDSKTNRHVTKQKYTPAPRLFEQKRECHSFFTLRPIQRKRFIVRNDYISHSTPNKISTPSPEYGTARRMQEARAAAPAVHILARSDAHNRARDSGGARALHTRIYVDICLAVRGG